MVGTEHHVKLIPLAVHRPAALSWGRPWRKHSLNLPAPRVMRFQGLQLPMQPLRSWLHLLSRAGMLGRPAPLPFSLQPDEDIDAPADIADLGFELSADMLLDFAQFAQAARLKSEEEGAAGDVADEETILSARRAEPAGSFAGTREDEIPPFGPAEPESLSLDSIIDQDFPELHASAQPPDAMPSVEPAPQQTEVLAVDTTDEPESLAPAEQSVSEVVEPIAAQQLENSSIREAEQQSAQEVRALSEAEALETQAAISLEVLEAPADIEQPTPVVGPAAETKVAGTIVVTARVAPRVPDVVEPSAPEPLEHCEPEREEVPEVVAADVSTALEPAEEITSAVANDVGPVLAEAQRIVEEPQPEVLDVAEQTAPPTTAQGMPTTTELAELSAREVPEDAMQWELVEPIQPSERIGIAVEEVGLLPSEHPPSDDHDADECFEPMISSLAEAFALLAAAGGHGEPCEEIRVAQSHDTNLSPAERAVAAPEAADSTPETVALQGILIQKESEMTEMHDDVVTQADVQESAIPITSAELQEVAATLSVPHLDADPDDVLSDVQNTLNSLAGMAQGLTHQKQAAGRLQEELEEWNSQLQERERLTADKEERLLQMESHLKQAKTNLDRMAAENNRLLAERSEALKNLAHTVDLRDKATAKRAESIQLEQQRIDEQLAALRSRAGELDERESAIKRKSEELTVRLKQLQSAKDKFSTIVKSFNETVQFNTTLSAISKTVTE